MFSPTARASRPTVGDLAATLRLAWPLVLSNLAATALTTTDILVIGRLGSASLAAAALATNLYHTLLIGLIGLVSAVSPLVAAEFGARRHAVREIRRSVRAGLWVAAGVSVPACALLWQGEGILLALGQDPALAAPAGRYLRFLLPALPPTLFFVVLRLLIASVGRPGWGLAVALAALPLNLGLAVLLVHGGFGLPGLGLPGAGIATTLTSAAGLAALAAVLGRDRRFRRYHVFGRLWRGDATRLRAVLRIGLPIAGTLLLETTLFGASGMMMGTLGAAELAAHTIALQISGLCFMVPLGLGQAATIRVGHAFGGGDPDAVGRAGWAAFGLALAFTALTAALLFAMPGTLIGLFVDGAAEPEVMRLGILFLAFSALFQLADGTQVVCAGMLRGLQDTRVPMMLAALGYWGIGAPLGFLLAKPLGFGGAGIWAGLAIGLASVALLLAVRWTRRDRIRPLPPPALDADAPAR